MCACKDTLVSRVILSHIWHTNACVIEREGIFMAFKARLCFLVPACSVEYFLIIIKFHAAVVTMCFSAALWPKLCCFGSAAAKKEEGILKLTSKLWPIQILKSKNI